RARERPAAALRLLRLLRDARHSHLLPRAGDQRTGRSARQRMNARARAAAAGVALAGVLIILGLRAEPRINLPGRVEPSRGVLRVFRAGVYCPVAASRGGRNPYARAPRARTSPGGQSFPPYPPLPLLAPLPFGLLPHAEAGDLYLAVVVGLT